MPLRENLDVEYYLKELILVRKKRELILGHFTDNNMNKTPIRITQELLVGCVLSS